MKRYIYKCPHCGCEYTINDNKIRGWPLGSLYRYECIRCGKTYYLGVEVYMSVWTIPEPDPVDLR